MEHPSLLLLPVRITWESAWQDASFEEVKETLKSALGLLEEKTHTYPDSWHRAVKQAISKGVRVDGFTKGHAWKAPPGKILQAIKKRWPAPKYGGILLKYGSLVWATQHRPLIDQVRAWLEKSGYLWVTAPLNEETPYALEWAIAQSLVAQVMADLQQTFAEENEDSLGLSLWILWRHFTLPDEQITQIFQSQDLPAEVKSILEHLQSITPESKIWAEPLNSLFLRSIEAIAISKRLSLRMGQARAALQEALEALAPWQERYEDLPLERWKAEKLSTEKLVPTVELVHALQNALKAHYELETNPPSKMAERTSWYQRLQERIKQVQELISKVDATFAEASGEENEALSKGEEEESTGSDEGEEGREREKDGGADQSKVEVHEAKESELVFIDEAAEGQAQEEEGAILKDVTTEAEQVQEQDSASPLVPSPGDPTVPQKPRKVKDAAALETEGKVERPAASPFNEPQEVIRKSVPSVLEQGQEELRAREKVLAAVAENDIALAYWVAWAQEHLGARPAFPSKLLEGIQIARWVTDLWPQSDLRLVEELSRWQTSLSNGQSEEVNQILEPWIALVAILSGGAGSVGRNAMPWPWLDWIPTSSEYWQRISPALARVWAEVRALIIAVGEGLNVTHVFDQESKPDYHRLAQQWAKDAETWLKEAPHRKFSYQRASWLWQFMVRKQSSDEKSEGAEYSIYRWLSVVAQDERSRKGEVIEQITDWQERLEEKLDDASRWEVERRGKVWKRIEASSRASLLKRIREALELAQNWTQAVSLYEREQRYTEKQERYRVAYRAIQQAIQQAPQEIQAYLNGSGKEQPAEQRVALGVLATWLEDIRQKQNNEPSRQSNVWTRLVQIAKAMGISQLEIALSSRIFARTTSVPFFTDEKEGLRLWLPESAQDVLAWGLEERLFPAVWWADLDVIKQWAIKLYNFQLAYASTVLLPQEEAKEIVQQDLEDWWLSALESLHQQVTTLTPQVEAAHRDAVLPEHAYQELRSELVRLDDTLRSYRKAQPSIETIDDLSSIHQGFRSIQKQLNEFTQRRIQDLQGREVQLIRDMGARWGHTDPKVKQAQDHLTRLRKNNDWRGLEEYLKQIEEALQGAQPDLLEKRARHLPSLETLKHFLQNEGRIYGRLSAAYQGRARTTKVWEAIGSSVYQPWFVRDNLPGPRKAQSNQAAKAWLTLKQRESQRITTLWAHLLEFLGLQVVSPQRDITPDTVTHSNIKRWKVRITPQLVGGIAEENWIPHEWGSSARGTYLITAVWERPDPEQVLPFLQDAQSPQLLFYFGTLTRLQRMEWGRALRRERVKALLIDEVVFWFLVGYPSSIPTVFHCTLPFGYANPYSPTGRVEEEMFFGAYRRDNLLKPLAEPKGRIGVLYGGRQLGKTALLIRAQSTFHHPSDKRAAFYLDIKGIENAADPYKALWRHISSKLSTGVEGEKWLRRMTEEPDKIYQALEKHILQGWSFRLFLDEADYLLNLESEHGFPALHRFRDLEMLTSGGFKVVLAGLHNVQRHTRVPNHPLAQLGESKVVGPLKYKDAEDLLTIPLAGLGIAIENEEILRILSYTNRHPGLIQLFAREIVDAVNRDIVSGRRSLEKLPVKVQRDQIEQIYDNAKVRDEIRKRFQWTIDLDARYRAIALFMALETLDDPRSFERWYSSKDIMHTLSDWLEWGRTPVPNLLEVTDILSEMEELGILLSNEQKKYRLRSPNVIPLLGEQREIEEEFYRIASTDPSLKKEARHYKIGEGRFTPFDERERRLIFQHPVTLVLGSPDTGLKEVKPALEHFVQLMQPQWKFETLEPTSKQIAHLRKVIRPSRSKKNDKSVQYITMIEMPRYFDPEDIYTWLHEAARSAHLFEKTRRIVFVLDENLSFEFARWLHQGKENELLNQITLLPLQKWNRAALQQALQAAGYLATEQESISVQNITGGWHILVQEMFAQAAQEVIGDNASLSEMKREIKHEALRGSPLSISGHSFLHWVTSETMHAALIPTLKTLLTMWDANEPELKFDDAQLLKEITAEDASLPQEEIKALWQFLLWMGILEEEHRQEGKFYFFDLLARKRLQDLLKLR